MTKELLKTLRTGDNVIHIPSGEPVRILSCNREEDEFTVVTNGGKETVVSSRTLTRFRDWNNGLNRPLSIVSTAEAAEVEDKEAPTVKALQSENKLLRRQLQSRAGHADLMLARFDEWVSSEPLELDLPPTPLFDNKGQEEVATLIISDVQLAKRTPTYSIAIAEQRLMKAVEKTIRITEVRRAAATISKIKVFFIGDLVEGETIFAHQAWETEANLMVQACREGPRIFAQMLAKLAEHFTIVETHWVSGNHGRAGFKKGPNHPDTNWDSVAAFCTRGTLYSAGPDIIKRVKFNITDDDWYQVVDVEGWGCLLFHGHQIAGGLGAGGNPFKRKIQGWVQTLSKPFNYTFHGHFHNPLMVGVNDVICYQNGTVESSSRFALEILAAEGVPMQWLMFFNKKHGLISENMLWLDKRRPAKSRK